MSQINMSNFDKVCAMNVAFGNAWGDPSNIDWAALTTQAQGAASEVVEWFKALGTRVEFKMIEALPKCDIEAARDAMCDVMVFVYGGFHRVGIDADRDMDSVLEGVMSRFCKDEADLRATRAKYDKAGVAYTEHGTFPKVFLRSAHDQLMPEYPKGKFLKSASYRQAVFYPLPAPPPPVIVEPPVRRFMAERSVTDQMAADRAALTNTNKVWRACREEIIKKLSDGLDKVSDEGKACLMDGTLTMGFQVVRTAT